MVSIADKGDFIRQQYLHINWFTSKGKKITSEEKPYADITSLDIYCEFQLNRSGAFHLYFTYDVKG